MLGRSRALCVSLLTVITCLVAAQSVDGLDGCYSAFSVEAHPLCCQQSATHRIALPEHGCCKDTSIAARPASGTTSSSPLVFAAPATFVTALALTIPSNHAFALTGGAIERPPDRSPRGTTAVLLL